jgi:hypothetical protein
MYDEITRRKNELKVKANLLAESINQEFNILIKDSSILPKIGLLGGGAILIYFLSGNLFKSSGEIIQDKNQSGDFNKNIESISSTESSLKNQFNEKIIIIGLEILRQMLIIAIGKLKIKDGKKDI